VRGLQNHPDAERVEELYAGEDEEEWNIAANSCHC